MPAAARFYNRIPLLYLSYHTPSKKSTAILRLHLPQNKINFIVFIHLLRVFMPYDVRSILKEN